MALETRSADLVASTRLLGAELPDPRFVDQSYLRWLYDENPLGPAYEANDDDGDVATRGPDARQAHYALIPQVYRDAGGARPFVFSLNAVTRSTTQRRGSFQRLGAQVYAAAAAAGVDVVVGVSNANSTPPVVRRMGWRLAGPLPVSVALARRRPADWWSAWVSPEVLADERFVAAVEHGDKRPARAFTNVWSPDSLRWRLQPPNAKRYAIHVGPEALAVSTVDHAGPVALAVLLKVLPLGPWSRLVDGRPLVGAVCSFHGTPALVYAGWNRWLDLPGRRLPTRFRPVPLNLIVRSLDPALPQERIAFDTFEFLDMDAY